VPSQAAQRPRHRPGRSVCEPLEPRWRILSRCQYGFIGPDVSRGTYPGTVARVSYHRGGTTIEVSPDHWYMGEEYVATRQVSVAPDGAERRT
jgi:hypothetical protein